MEFHHSRTMTRCGAGRRGHSIFGGAHPFLRPTLRSPGPERGSFLKCYAWGLSCPTPALVSLLRSCSHLSVVLRRNGTERLSEHIRPGLSKPVELHARNRCVLSYANSIS